MPLVTTTEMFKKAYDGGYAIGAFNVNNMEIVQGITEAAKEVNAPLILQVSKGARAYANHTYLIKLVEAAIAETGLPICLHLDHGDSFELCKSCVDGGFTSVMIDASSKPFEENIEITKKVVEYAHDHGVVVEAELGALAGVEDEVNVSAEDSHYTRPEEVADFVGRTGCDALAIAMVLSGALIALIALVPCQATFYLGGIGFGMAQGFSFPILTLLAVNNVPQSHRGTANSTMLMAGDLGVGLGTLLWGISIQFCGFHVSIALSGLAVILSGVLSLLFYCRCKP